MRMSNLEKVRRAKRKQYSVKEMDLNQLMLLMVAGDVEEEQRRANPTQERFIWSSGKRELYMGAAGAAKTTSIVGRVMLHALLEPGTRHVIARANFNDLLETTLDEAQKMLDRLPQGTLLDRTKKAPMQWVLNPLAKAGDDVEPSTITFMGLQDGLGGYKFHGGCVDEVDEVDEKRFHELWTRCRLKGGTNYLVGATNPPPTTHWLYTAVTGMDHSGKKIREPYLSLFTPVERENEHNLRPGYYDDLLASLPPDMADRLVHGQWGAVYPGDPVFRQFKLATHGRRLKYHGGATLFRFWDFGFRQPVCLFCQVDALGRCYILRELIGKDTDIRSFAEQVKLVTRQEFDFNAQTFDVGDPAVAQKKDTGSTLQVLFSSGIQIHFRHTPFEPSLQLCQRRFNELIEGEPAVQIDDRYCAVTVAAFQGGYAFSDKGDVTKPRKDGYYDHQVDAWRYGMYYVLGQEMLGIQASSLETNIEYSRDEDFQSQ